MQITMNPGESLIIRAGDEVVKLRAFYPFTLPVDLDGPALEAWCSKHFTPDKIVFAIRHEAPLNRDQFISTPFFQEDHHIHDLHSMIKED